MESNTTERLSKEYEKNYGALLCKYQGKIRYNTYAFILSSLTNCYIL